MIRLLSGLLLALGLLAPSPRVSEAARLRVLVDGSGSMRGYFATGGIQPLVQQLERAAAAADFEPETSIFTSRAELPDLMIQPLVDWLASPQGTRYGTTTRLDALLRDLPPGEALVIITDNFQDDAGEAVGKTQDFYRGLQQSALERVFVAPALLAFDGRVEVGVGRGIPPGPGGAHDLQNAIRHRTSVQFLGNDGAIGLPEWRNPKNGNGFWRIPYRGQRGLAVYFLLTRADSALTGRFTHFVDESAKSTVATPLLIRPLGTGAVRLKPAASARPDPRALACAGLKAEQLPAPNLSLLVDPKTSRYSLGLTDEQGLSYDPRKPAQFVAAFDVVSTEAHIQITPGQTCAQAATVSASPLRVTAREEGVLLPDVRGRSEARPAHLVAPLDASAEGPRAVFLVVDLPPLVGPQVPFEAFAGQLRAELDVEIHVPPNAWRTDPKVQRRYFSSDPLDLGHIFSPKDLVQVLAPPTISLRLPVTVQPELINQAPAHKAPASFPSWIVWLVVAFLVCWALWHVLRPFGMRVPLQVDGQRGRSIVVGGMLSSREGRLAVSEALRLRVTRAAPFGPKVVIWDGTRRVCELFPGQREVVAQPETKVRYLTGAELRALIRDGGYDER